MIKITQSEKYGREVTATEFIYQDDTVTLCEILVLNQDDTITVNRTELQFYTFKFNDHQDCLVLGYGEIFNHSDTPNVTYDLVEHEGRIKMRFKALRDIELGEQLFINYNKDVNVDVTTYINKNLMGVI